MNISVKSKKINDFTYELSISAKWEDIKSDFLLAKKKVASDIKIPGFRKGKVPENILMSQYLPSIEMAFVQNSCEKYYMHALQKEDFIPINQAQLKDIDFSYEKDLSFKAEFEIEPKFNLPKFKKNMVTVEKLNFVTNDEEVEKTINNILASQAKAEQIESNIQNEDFLIVDVQELDDSGLPIIGNKEKKYIAVGQDPFVEDRAKSLIGKNKGDKVKVVIDMGSGEKNYEFSIDTIQRRVLPELNEEFIKTIDPNCESVEDWKKNVKESIIKEYEKKSEEMFNSALIDQFVKLASPIVPNSMLENYLSNIIAEVKKNQNNPDLDEAKVREEYQLFAENNLKWFLLRKNMINTMDFKVEKSDVDHFISEAIKNNDNQKAEIERFYKKEANRNKLSDDLVDQKIIEFLKENSKIKNKEQKTSELEANQNK